MKKILKDAVTIFIQYMMVGAGFWCGLMVAARVISLF